MKLSALIKNSLIDYPEKVSSVIFVQGCNFDCPYCHNPDLVRRTLLCPCLIEEKKIFDFLKSRRGLLDGVVISGGEPTLQRDLLGFCARIKEMGYAVKLDTNGSRPETIKRLIDGELLDYIAMDIKTDPYYYTTFIDNDNNPEGILSSIEIIMDSDLDYEFRTTCVRPIVDEGVIENIAKMIEGATLYALQRFHDEKVLHPGFFIGTEAKYSDSELMHLRAIAQPWVNACIVR